MDTFSVLVTRTSNGFFIASHGGMERYGGVLNRHDMQVARTPDELGDILKAWGNMNPDADRTGPMPSAQEAK